MRKIIPFIASNYRKDKIWLRRTKPSKRDYFVMVAVDDSSRCPFRQTPIWMKTFLETKASEKFRPKFK
jgi:midasin (ATPase involved in ribosome maturation)